jgi:hypothetical protein
MISSFLLLSLALGGGGRDRGDEGPPLRPPPGWAKADYGVHFSADDLHEYLNGGAAKYLAYDIQDLYVQEYERVSDGHLAVVELYVMDSPQNAFGVYSCDSGGAHPTGLGEEASFEGGLLQFWSGRAYVRVYPRDPSAGKEDAILELGAALSKGPAFGAVETTPGEPSSQEEKGFGEKAEGGDAPLPAIVTSMPADGLIRDSMCFFHMQVSLNNIYYLSEKNILRLSKNTDAVSAEYETPSGGAARVIAVCYPEVGTASAAYEAFCDLYMEASSEVRMPDGARERWVRAGDSEWLYAGVIGGALTLVLEAATESDAIELGRRVLGATAGCGEED